MPKIPLTLFLFIAAMFSSQTKWMTLERAIEAQKIQPKKILIDFYADWCTGCKTMDQKTYDNPYISKIINENYYPVKFNAESRESLTIFGRTFTNNEGNDGSKKHPLHGFTKFMSVSSVPTTVFLDEQTMPITILQGALMPKEIEPYLSFIANDGYKKINSREEWDNYQKKFKSKLQD